MNEKTHPFSAKMRQMMEDTKILKHTSVEEKKTITLGGLLQKCNPVNTGRIYPEIVQVEHKPMENLFMPDSMRLYSGRYLNLLKMDPDDILLDDIAHGLASHIRFGGHILRPYTVAQHAVWGSYRFETIEEAFEYLNHDDTEAYLVDMPSPVKKLLPQYYELEAKLNGVICKKFNIKNPMSPSVKAMDEAALVFEWENFVIRDTGLEVWTLEEAKQKFINRFNELNALR